MIRAIYQQGLGFILFPVQIHSALSIIEHLIVVVCSNLYGVALFEEAAFGNVQAHHILLALTYFFSI